MTTQQPYRVLARAYRPQHFGQLIGQDVLVRTLTNAIQMNRVAQAYMLTGVRGVGKTTTARIIAKSLNHSGGPTAGPTDDCPICQAITAGTHPDVIEIDAASNTSVDNIREIIDSVAYAPLQARYKVYIIDEVHMLSNSAFNALLKTLEEPPSHVIFIFATTEIRKVPITILSRCQRFDLRRVEPDVLGTHLGNISKAEGAAVEDDAIALLARAADGSVRDALSLLDRAIALATGAPVTAPLVQDMLGLSDHRAVFDLWAMAIGGNSAGALAKADQMRRDGADPHRLAMDFCNMTHRAIRAKMGAALPEDGAEMTALVEPFSLPALNRAWGLCLRGVQEVKDAPDAAAALDILIVRLAYAADLPDPGKVLKALHESAQSVPTGDNGGRMVQQSNGAPVMVSRAVAQPQNLHDVVALAQNAGDVRLAAELRHGVEIVALRAGVIELALAPHVPVDLHKRLGRLLEDQTGQRWMITIAGGQSVRSLAAQEAEDKKLMQQKILEIPAIQDILSVFPTAGITAIHNLKE